MDDEDVEEGDMKYGVKGKKGETILLMCTPNENDGTSCDIELIDVEME